MAWFSFIKRAVPTGGGVGNHAVAAYRLPAERQLGAGVFAGTYEIAQAKYFVQPQMAPLIGLGGVISGGMVNQPLVDPQQFGLTTDMLTPGMLSNG